METRPRPRRRIPPAASSIAGGTRALMRRSPAGTTARIASPPYDRSRRVTGAAAGEYPHAVAARRLVSGNRISAVPLGEQRLNALLPRPIGSVPNVKLAGAFVPNPAALIDQNEARPVADGVTIPRAPVVVLGVG